MSGVYPASDLRKLYFSHTCEISATSVIVVVVTARASATSRTFVQGARRVQLIDCAIDVIADVGVDRASMVRIAERAKVNRGVISYHFDDRDDLFDGVVIAVYELASREVGPGVMSATTPGDALAAFIEGSIAFYARYPRHMLALSAIFASGRTVPQRARENRGEHTAEMLEVESILAAGKRDGSFRDFDTSIMARTLRAALDSALRRLVAGDSPQLLADELRKTFEATTIRESS